MIQRHQWYVAAAMILGGLCAAAESRAEECWLIECMNHPGVEIVGYGANVNIAREDAMETTLLLPGGCGGYIRDEPCMVAVMPRIVSATPQPCPCAACRRPVRQWVCLVRVCACDGRVVYANGRGRTPAAAKCDGYHKAARRANQAHGGVRCWSVTKCCWTCT